MVDSRHVSLGPTDHVCGCVILQQFVHDSNYFAFTAPLDTAGPPDPETGAFTDVAELSVFCAKGCGAKLLRALVEFASAHTSYRFLVTASTKAAEPWYTAQGFRAVTTLRLPLPLNKKGMSKVLRAHQPQLYRHRIPDAVVDLLRDEPSIMLYLEVPRASAGGGPAPETPGGACAVV